MRGVAEQVHHDGAPGDSLVDVEQVGAGYPAILLRLLPRSTVLPHADDDIETVVPEVEALTVTLRAVTDQSERVVLEVFLDAILANSYTKYSMDILL